MDAKTKEEIELLQELIDSPDTPQDEKDLYRDTIKELKAEAEKSKPEPKKEEAKPKSKTGENQTIKDFYTKEFPTDPLGKELDDKKTFKDVWNALLKGNDVYKTFGVGDSVIRERIFEQLAKLKSVDYDVIYNAWLSKGMLTESEILSKKTDKTSKGATKKEAPKKLPVDADKMKAEIKDRTGKTEEECEVIIAEYRQLREKSKKIEAKRLGKLDDEGKLIAGTKEKTAAAVIETAAENIKDKLEKQVDKLEKEAEKGDRTPEQIEARINKNLGQLSKEMTKQATGFIKGIQSELAKADKTEAKQFLMNVRAEIDDLLSKFGGGGWLRDRRQVNQREDYETRYEKKNNTGRTNYAKKKNSVGSTFGRGGGVGLNTEVILTENRENGAVTRAVVKPFMLESIEDNQYKGGFKRYEIDIYDEVEREPTKKEIEELNSFFDKVGGRFDVGGFVQTYNITQGNMSSSSVNPSQFAVGGSVEDQISYADRRIDNLKELRSVSNEDMKENIDFQIEAIEKQKSRLLSGELVPRKRLFGLF
jgi:hypothetical protein